MARVLKPRVKIGKSHHCSFAVYKSRVICVGVNDYTKSHRHHRFGHYRDYKGFTTPYEASMHSEAALAIRLGEESWEDYEIVNIRVGNNDDIRMACPCANCVNMLIKPLGPKRVFYSTDANDFQELDLS